MKALATIFVVATLFSLIVVAVILAILALANELRKPTCRNCNNYDDAMSYCWAKGKHCDPSCKGCELHLWL